MRVTRPLRLAAPAGLRGGRRRAGARRAWPRSRKILRRIDAQPLFGAAGACPGGMARGHVPVLAGRGAGGHAARRPAGGARGRSWRRSRGPSGQIRLSCATRHRPWSGSARRRTGFFYLYGVTGSGKTEVFLRAAAAVLARGRGVIYLVPEISLTHQVVEMFARRFGSHIAVLHSGLSPSQAVERSGAACAAGEAHLVIGARSAVFAPGPGPGPGGDRRGARGLLQVGHHPALPRPAGGHAPGPGREGASWSWAAPPPPWRPGTPSGRARIPCLTLGQSG